MARSDIYEAADALVAAIAAHIYGGMRRDAEQERQATLAARRALRDLVFHVSVFMQTGAATPETLEILQRIGPQTHMWDKLLGLCSSALSLLCVMDTRTDLDAPFDGDVGAVALALHAFTTAREMTLPVWGHMSSHAETVARLSALQILGEASSS